MTLYCGIDLHSNNHVVVVIDENDKRVFEGRLPNDVAVTLEVLRPYKADLQGVAVESTFRPPYTRYLFICRCPSR